VAQAIRFVDDDADERSKVIEDIVDMLADNYNDWILFLLPQM